MPGNPKGRGQSIDNKRGGIIALGESRLEVRPGRKDEPSRGNLSLSSRSILTAGQKRNGRRLCYWSLGAAGQE